MRHFRIITKLGIAIGFTVYLLLLEDTATVPQSGTVWFLLAPVILAGLLVWVLKCPDQFARIVQWVARRFPIL